MADETDAGTGLPASIAAAWGLRERPRKGPRRGLSLERIVEAAVRIASSDGLAAVSMSRVAAELGASTMSLYRYVAAKDDLLPLMSNAAFGTPPAASDPAEGWRPGLVRWAWANLAVLRRHPWVLRIPISGPPITPNEVAWFESGLACLRGTGLTEGEKVSVILLLNGLVRNEATLAATIEAAYRASGWTPREAISAYGGILGRLADAARFPEVRALLAAGVFDVPDDPDAEFAFGLERTLDGIEKLVRTRLGGGG